MATLTPTLTLASSDIFADQPLALTVTDSLTVQAPMTDISRMNTNDDIGNGTGIIVPEDTNQYYVYLKHTGILASDGTTAANATADFVTFSDADATAGGLVVKLFPGEFAFFPIKEGDGSAGSGGDGGLKVTAASAEVQMNYAFFKRS